MLLPGDHAWKELNEDSFADQNLDRSDFTGAQLRRADFWGASLRDCVFCFADLEDADLGLADLAGADFTGAWLGGATVAAANHLYAPGAFYGGREHWEPMRDLVADFLHGRCSVPEAVQRAHAFTAPEPMEVIAELLFDRGELDHARTLMRSAYDLGGTLNAARMLARMLPVGPAIALLQSIETDDIGLLGDLGALLMRTGNVNQARPLLRIALEGDTPDPLPYYAAAQFDLSEGRIHEARKLLTLAVERGPRLPFVRVAFAALLIELGEPVEALKHLDVVVRSAAHPPAIDLDAAELLLRTGRADLALDLLLRTQRAAFPAQAQHRWDRVHIHALTQLGRAADAQDAAAIARDPLGSSVAAWGAGDVPSALRHAQQATPSLPLVDWLVDMNQDATALSVLEGLIGARPPTPAETERQIPLLRRVAPDRLTGALGHLWERPGGMALASVLQRGERWTSDRASTTLLQIAGEAPGLRERLPADVILTAPPHPLFPDGLVACGRDAEGPTLLVDSRLCRPTGAAGWTTTDEGTPRRWRRTDGAAVAPVRGSVSPDALLQTVRSHAPVGTHPLLTAGIARSLHALLPADTSAALRARIPSMLQALAAHHGVDDAFVKGLPTAPVVDGFGPELMVMVAGTPVVLPELPPVLTGPEGWNAAQWWAATATDWGAFYTEGVLRLRPIPSSVSVPLVILALVWGQMALRNFVIPLPEHRLWTLFDHIQRRTVHAGAAP